MAADAAAAGSGHMHVVVDGLHGDTNQTKPLEYFWNLSKITQLHSVPNSEKLHNALARGAYYVHAHACSEMWVELSHQLF